jgi:hypothetical protein
MDKHSQDQSYGQGQQSSNQPNRTKDQSGNKDQQFDRNQGQQGGNRDQGQSAAGRPNQSSRDAENR